MASQSPARPGEQIPRNQTSARPLRSAACERVQPPVVERADFSPCISLFADDHGGAEQSRWRETLNGMLYGFRRGWEPPISHWAPPHRPTALADEQFSSRQIIKMSHGDEHRAVEDLSLLAQNRA